MLTKSIRRPAFVSSATIANFPSTSVSAYSRCNLGIKNSLLRPSSFTPNPSSRLQIPNVTVTGHQKVFHFGAAQTSCALAALPSFGAGLAVLGFIVFVHEAGHYIAARTLGIRVENFSLGFGPPLLEWRSPSGVLFSLRSLPLGGYVSFPEKTIVDEETEEEIESDCPDLLQNRPVLDRAIVISAGVIANIMLAWAALFTSVSTVGVPMYDFHPGALLQTLVDDKGPGALAGLRGGDVILAVNGVTVESNLGSAASVADLIRNSNGKEMSFLLSRNDKEMTIKVRPNCSSDGNCAMGVQLVPNVDINRVRPPSFALTLRTTNDELMRLSNQTWNGLISIVINFDKTASQLSGPIGVVSLGANLARNDAAALFTFVAVISINLALLNSLPIPALDGGQFVFILIEGLRGAPVPLKLQNALNTTAFLVFFALSGMLLLNDIAKFNIFSALR